MSTPKHTPGPWVYKEGRIETLPDDNGVSLCIGEVFPSNVYHAGNALLIAAAPDLLAAVVKFVAAWDSAEWLDDNDVAEFRAALAKAAGKEGS